VYRLLCHDGSRVDCRKISSNDYGLLSLLEEVPKSEQLMPQIVFETLPVVMESEDSAHMCFLCACSVVAGSKVTLLPCGCVEKSPIHQHWLQEWVVRSSATCLVRRAPADPEHHGQKGTKRNAQPVLAEEIGAEPRASGGGSDTGQKGEADRNTLWEQLVLQLGHSSAHLAMFEGAEGFLKHRQSTTSEDLFLLWPPSLFWHDGRGGDPPGYLEVS